MNDFHENISSALICIGQALSAYDDANSDVIGADDTQQRVVENNLQTAIQDLTAAIGAK